MSEKLDTIKALAMKFSHGAKPLYNTIIKEILHRDILWAISQSPLSKSLVFQGGTALRLCYGNNRYSEDLDFVHNQSFTSQDFEQFKELLTTSISERYGLSVKFKDPKVAVGEPANASGVTVRRWVAQVTIDDPQPDAKKSHKIHIEVADIPAYDARPRQVANPYQALLGSPSVLLQVSSEKEILADKVIAVMGRSYLKARDIWDIKFLSDRNIPLTTLWVHKKAYDYQMDVAGNPEAMKELLLKKAGRLALPEVANTFRDEMSRFLSQDLAEQWLSTPLGVVGLLMDVSEYLERQSELIGSNVDDLDSQAPDRSGDQLAAWHKRHGITKPNH
jgi:predicted nucleotidyltransferase component of viral defense system